MDKTIIILRGIPGSGKSTFAKYLLTLNYNPIICSADDYFIDENNNYNFDASKLSIAHKECQLKCKNSMEKSLPIIITNTNTTEKELKVYFKLAKKYNYNIFSLIIENRHNNENIHNVSNKTINKMKNKFSISL